MKNHPITRERIDELLRFKPTLGVAGPDTKLETDPNSTYPSYTTEVEEFFTIVDRWWQNSYDPQQHGAMLRDSVAVGAANVNDVKSMLTFCLRGERFSDGHWLTVIREGLIGSILDRLTELRKTID